MRILSGEELKFIKNNLDKLTIKQLCTELKISQSVLYRNLKQNNLKKKYVLTDRTPKRRGNLKYRAWTREELDFLEKNYSKMNTKEIVNILDRSYYAIMSMVKKKGLYKIILGQVLTTESR